MISTSSVRHPFFQRSAHKRLVLATLPGLIPSTGAFLSAGNSASTYISTTPSDKRTGRSLFQPDTGFLRERNESILNLPLFGEDTIGVGLEADHMVIERVVNGGSASLISGAAKARSGSATATVAIAKDLKTSRRVGDMDVYLRRASHADPPIC